MKRNEMLKIINPVLGILLINQVLTALLNGVLPEEAFEILHEGGGVTLTIIAIIHLILNWGWIKSSYFRKQPKAE